MAPNSRIRERLPEDEARDPREQQGAEVIDLATRNVLPAVSQRKRGDSLGLVAGIAIVAALGALTLWSMDAARTGAPQQDEAARAAAGPQTLPAAAPAAPAPQRQPAAPAAPAPPWWSTPAPCPARPRARWQPRRPAPATATRTSPPASAGSEAPPPPPRPASIPRPRSPRAP